MQRQIQIITNYFEVRLNSDIYKYELEIDNGVLNEQMTEVNAVMFKNKDNRDMLYRTFG